MLTCLAIAEFDGIKPVVPLVKEIVMMLSLSAAVDAAASHGLL
jgi:hypothetical protein